MTATLVETQHDGPPLCVMCDHRPAERDSLVCRTCPRRLADDLRELHDGVDRLDPAPTSGGGQGGARPPGFGSRSPARDVVLALTDRRGYVDPERPAALVGVPVTLGTWTARMEDAGYGWASAWSPHDVAEVVRVWWEGPELARAIRGALAHVRRALGEVENTVPIGACPVVVGTTLDDEGEEVAALCGGEIRAKAYGQTARCTRCPAVWRGEVALRVLGGALGDAWMDLAALSRYLDVPSPRLRKWASRDGWRRQDGAAGTLRRTLYSLADARGSWWRAWERANPVLGPHPDEAPLLGPPREGIALPGARDADWPLLGPHRADWEGWLTV